MLWKRRTYLDTAAGVSGNPSSPHEEGRRAKQMLEDARTVIARLCEVQSDDVIFTSGATESNALAILGVAHASAIALKAPVHVLYLPSAHASIALNANMLAAYGATAEPLPLRDYRVDTDALANMLRKETVLVSMDAVCGETGVIWNTREVKQAIGKIFLHVDASQAPLTEKPTRAHFGADLLTLDGAKVGVRGIGALIAHRTIPLVPLYRGGGQERGLRPGSESPELAKSFAAALGAAAHGREAFRASAERNRAHLIELIKNIPNVLINESRSQAPNILNLSLPGRDTDYLVALLDEAGFAVSTRSACESNHAGSMIRSPADERSESWQVTGEGSRAVLALTGDRNRAFSTLRISWGAGTGAGSLVRFSRALARAVAFIDSNSHG
ncbi:aminotransferase class V-fold PLP-dependent enzyme [Patescibacteria group bacterium]|nr:aminotransferase class V-fold PLP-dependent enzyme [Patescibacteria group bacterium]